MNHNFRATVLGLSFAAFLMILGIVSIRHRNSIETLYWLRSEGIQADGAKGFLDPWCQNNPPCKVNGVGQLRQLREFSFIGTNVSIPADAGIVITIPDEFGFVNGDCVTQRAQGVKTCSSVDRYSGLLSVKLPFR